MNTKIPRIEQLIPFIIMGIAIALAIGVFIVLSYVLLWGIVIGSVIWLVVFLKNYFFSKQSLAPQEEGRIIEHHENKD